MLHEESSVAMAHGYFKIEGKPLAVLAHGTVGLQHAAMAIYNAYCDRVPVFIVLGNTLDATMRRPGVEWTHSVQDAAAMVRDYIKWDDTPRVAAALRRVGGARLQDRDDAAVWPGGASWPTASCRSSRSRRSDAARAEADAGVAAAGRFRRGRGSSRGCSSAPSNPVIIADGRRGRRPGWSASSSSRSCCRRGHRSGRPHELSRRGIR